MNYPLFTKMHFPNCRAVLFLASAALLISGCHSAKPIPAGTSAPTQQPSALSTLGIPSPAPASANGSPATYNTELHFTDVAARAGLHYRWKIAGPRPIDIIQGLGNGCAFLDYNNDGNLDILCVGPKLALYKGDGKGHFTDVTKKMGLAGLSGHFLGCAVGDYDNDGYPDIYISGYGAGLLLHNEAGKQFTDVTKQMGLRPQPSGTSCGFADLDGDGYLDLYVANYIEFGPKSKRYCEYRSEQGKKLKGTCGPMLYPAVKGVLYHNIGGHGFTDVTKAWGADKHMGKGLGVSFADFDGDGTTDMVIANDMVRGNTFKNLGKGRLTDISDVCGINGEESGEAYAGMGIDWGDYNNDGKLDLFVTTFDYESKYLYRNDGNGLFTNVSPSTGFIQSALPYISFGCKFFDANNDGWLDLIIASGHVADMIGQVKKGAIFKQPVQFFLNTTPVTDSGGSPQTQRFFANESRAAGIDQLPTIVGRGLAVGDFDNDGRVDALVVDSEGAPLLLHNECKQIGNWAGFRVRGGAGMNRDGYGALITVKAGGQTLTRQCQSCGSYLSSSDPRVHFGLAGATRIDRLTVRWPNGKVDTWTDLPIGAYFNLSPGKKPGS